jgi:hypothetical protein
VIVLRECDKAPRADTTPQALVVLIVLLLALILPAGLSVLSYLHFHKKGFYKGLLEIRILYIFSTGL